MSLPRSKWKGFQEYAVVKKLRNPILTHHSKLSYACRPSMDVVSGLTPYQIDTLAIKTHHKKFQLNPLETAELWVKKFRGEISKPILCYPQRWGEGQILHHRLVSSSLKIHHTKFQLNRSRNGWVIKNSKNLWWVVTKQELSHFWLTCCQRVSRSR